MNKKRLDWWLTLAIICATALNLSAVCSAQGVDKSEQTVQFALSIVRVGGDEVGRQLEAAVGREIAKDKRIVLIDLAVRKQTQFILQLRLVRGCCEQSAVSSIVLANGGATAGLLFNDDSLWLLEPKNIDQVAATIVTTAVQSIRQSIVPK
jgi:hypothetical protein